MIFVSSIPQTSADFEIEAPQRRSVVTVERAALVVLSVLLLASVSALIGVLSVNRPCLLKSAAKEEETKTTSTSAVPTYPNNVAQCGEDWELHGIKCYYFSPLSAKLPWKESRKMCQKLKGDLVKIESREEQMIDNGDKFWIGLTDSEAEGQWVWTDGSPLNSSLAFWFANDDNKEPDNWTVEDPEGEDCARMGEHPFIEGLKWWHDRSCQKKQRSICEKTAKILQA
uniref:C-type lectin domain-containing protein n=1 Tax=Neogobius melanostomus TaxID=47308 RepID=A0A8C6SWE4_9GOBI